MRTSRLSILVMVLVIIALFAMLCPAWGLGYDTPRTQKSGTSTGNWWTVNANSLTSGNLYLLQSTNTVAGGNIFAITSNTLTTGDFIQLTADDDALTSGKYINIFGASDHVTSVWNIGEGGATTITPPATTGVAKIPLYIDGTVLTTGDCLKLKAVSGTMTTGKVINCLDNATPIFQVADTGIVTLGGGATIDNNADAAILNLTETTVRATGILDVTGNSTLASLAVGGGYGSTGATVAATGNISTNGTLTVDGAISGLTLTEDVADGAETVVAGTDNGKHFICSSGAATITLPSVIAAGYIGMKIYVTQLADANLKITGASDDADFIYCVNKAGDADFVTFDQASEKIGATAMCMCVAANKWLIVNMTGDDVTLTVTDTD
jgi:hypothetical protein